MIADHSDGQQEFEDLATSMRRAMITKLCANRHKGKDWCLDSDYALLEKLNEEVQEIEELLAHKRRLPSHELATRIRGEAADIANVAAMIADKYGGMTL